MSSRERILVVDDDEAVALLHQRILERAGYAVSAANSVQGAVAVLQDVVADLIVTDYRLSETSTGLDLHTQLRELGCDIPVILVTGFSDEQTAISALRQGVRDLVPKTAAYLDYLPSAVERVLRQVRTERQLAQSESRFELFMDYSPAIAFIKDEQGRLLYANRGFEEACGNTSWRDKTDSELWPQPTAQQLRDHDEAVLAAGAPQQFNESLVHWDGTRRHWLTIRFPLPEADGRRLLGGMSLDVTQQKLAEEALRERDEQLRRSQKLESLGTLAGGVAHEFNNLLQAILEYTRFAMQAIPAHQPSYRDLEVVVKVAERASLLTKQLLGFSRRDTAQPADIDPNELVQDLVKLLRPLLGEHITVELALSDDVHCIYVDPGQIQQVLMNICINACDAMPSGGTLYISTCVLAIDDVSQVPSPDLNTGQYVVPSVRDTGSGMTPEVRERIFEPFFTTKEVGKGTGLGLAMVYGIVQQHRGAIHVESEINQGSTFTIYLPAAAAASAGKEIAASQPGHGERGTILVVEDEQLVLDLILRMLQELGYHTLTARDGCQAIEVFREHTAEIDLVLLDAVMPRMSGREACCRIKAIRPEVPVVFCTGYDRQGPSEELMPGGGKCEFCKSQSAARSCWKWCVSPSAGTGMPTGAINERAPGGGSVLVVDDEAAIRQLLVRWLTAAGYRCLEADCMAAADADRVRLAAPMHDIGKIGIPDGILRKPGRLTEAEFEVMKQHTTLGAAMLASSSSPVLRMAHDIALFHHERWDGLGYPLGVAGESIPEAARILTIVDVYDALTHDRVYRAALPETEVLRRMQSKQGRHFDPELLCAFLSILEEVQQIAAQYPDEALKHLSACFPSRLPTAVHTPSLLVGPSDP